MAQSVHFPSLSLYTLENALGYGAIIDILADGENRPCFFVCELDGSYRAIDTYTGEPCVFDGVWNFGSAIACRNAIFDKYGI